MLLKYVYPFRFLVIFVLFSTGLFSQSWHVVDTPSITGTPDFSDIFFVNENTGFITSSSEANIFKTVDGAGTFSKSATLYTTNAIHMLNATNGFSGGASGFIYNTTDGGLNWLFFGTMVSTLADISVPPSGDTGYACGINGNIYAITTSPNAVTKMTSGVPDTFSSISFPVDSNEGWVCGGSIIRHYVNNAWTASDQDYPSGGYNAIYFVDNNNGWVVGDSGVIAHTIDGKNWTAQTNPSSNSLFDVFFLNSQKGWAIGSGGTIIHTTNGGTTWTVVGAGLTSNSLTGVHFVSTINGNIGYVVGNGKTLIKYGMPLATEVENIILQTFSLSQNYPNPFNPITTIEFSIKEENIAILKIYDMGGNEVATILNDKLQSGNHQVEFNAENFSNGTYMYKLQIGDEVQSRKMVVLK